MKKIMNLRVPFILALSLIVGISSAYFIFMSKTVYAIVFLSIFIACISAYLINSIVCKKYLSGIALFLLSALFIITGYLSFNHVLSKYEDYQIGDHYYSAVQGKVESVRQTESGYMIILKDVSVLDNVKEKVDGKLALYVSQENVADIGDVVEFGAYVYTKPAIYEYKLSSSYIERNIKYTASVYSSSDFVVKYNDKNIFEKVNVIIRDALIEGMDGNAFATAYALLTGNSEYFDEDVITNFRQAGVAHIFAVSGLHIGFLYGALSFVFRKIKFNKYLSAVLIILSLVFYSGVCGFTASSIRATIMCSVMLIVRLFGQRYDGVSSLSISAIFILLTSPAQLLCAGFQLSFTVVFGILTCSPFLKSVFKFLPNKIASSLATVLPAYLFGIPISLYAFGQFSTIAIIVNLLFIPVVSFIFIMLLIATILSAIIGFSNVILFLPKCVLKAVIYVIDILDYKVFMVGGFTFGIFSLLYYLAMLIASGFFNFKKITKAIVSAVLIITCAVGITTKTLVDNSKTRLIVSGGENHAITLVDTPNTDVIIVSDINRYIPTSAIERVVSKRGYSPVVLIFLNVDGLDVQQSLTKINYVVKVDTVYFYAGSNENSQNVVQIIEKSFIDITAIPYEEGKLFTKEQITYSVDYNANSLLIEYENNKITIFKKFGSSNADYDRLVYSPNVAVVYDYGEFIQTAYKCEKIISYRKNSLYIEAESQGNLIYSLE